MSGKMRWRCSDTNTVVAAVDSATVIEIGDLVYQDINEAKPASMCNLQIQDRMIADLKKNKTRQMQEVFSDNFLGVAMLRSRSGDTDPIRVATTGVFEFDCEPGTFELGDLMGLAMILISDGTDSGEKDEYLANQQ